MTVLGTALLLGVLLAALAATGLWLLVARGRGTAQVACRCAVLAAVLALAAVILLEIALVTRSPALSYAERVTGPQMPVYYRLSAMWSALEGSLLLWLAILAVVAALGAWRARRLPTGAVAGTTLSAGVAAFAVVSLIASPFTAGAGARPSPSPLLQDHAAMGLHPPLLYAGFAVLAVPHALAVGAAVRGAADAAWARAVRAWALTGWVLLTAGIGLGAWWSYGVLGWGGYWAWDPVENASLLPWLTTTALLHTLLPSARRGPWQTWTIILAGTGFVLVLLAQFLTRSGVVESIHAFTQSPLGPLLLVLTVLALAAWLLPLLRTRPQAQRHRLGPREAALVGNRVLLLTVTVIVLVGTVLPTVLAAATGRRVAVGPPWYERTLAPVALALLVLMALGPWVPSRAEPVGAVLRRAAAPLLVSALAVGVVGFLVPDAWVALGAGLVAFTMTSLVLVARQRPGRRTGGAWTAHVGVAVVALAVLAGGQETVREQTVPVGGSVVAGDVSATLVDISRADEGRRVVAEAELVLGRDGRYLGAARPQLRWYEAESAMLTGPVVRTNAARDIYVTLLDVDPETGTATLRLAVTPLLGWLWVGGALMILGGAVAGWPRRRRPSRPGRYAGSPQAGEVPA